MIPDLEQITKQLNKLIDVIKVNDYTDGPPSNAELALIKITAEPGVRGEIMQIADVFRANVVMWASAASSWRSPARWIRSTR